MTCASPCSLRLRVKTALTAASTVGSSGSVMRRQSGSHCFLGRIEAWCSHASPGDRCFTRIEQQKRVSRGDAGHAEKSQNCDLCFSVSSAAPRETCTDRCEHRRLERR